MIKQKIGEFFTPLEWAFFGLDKFCIYDKWINGATIFDPTMGEGSLLESLIIYGLEQGKKLKDLPTENLFGNELNKENYDYAKKRFLQNYSLDMSSNFFNNDILKLRKRKFDIIYGNPPWINFVDLPNDYKNFVRDYFLKYELITDKHNVLLGNSRIDLAALIINVSISDFLKSDGEAFFFSPLSLFLNDGANNNFRNYKINNHFFSLEKIFDFYGLSVFDNVTTRYGLVSFKNNKKTKYPIPYFRFIDDKWREYLAQPIFEKTNPLSVFLKSESKAIHQIKRIKLSKNSCPRQGVNTCGANNVFFFDKMEQVIDCEVIVANKEVDNVKLPMNFVHPLITSKQFVSPSSSPSKWVLLPYNNNGKPLSIDELKKHPNLYKYLLEQEGFLKGRKGVLIQSYINRGIWWALLGVGAYSFAPYKIVWESYGRKNFSPGIFSSEWQANQSLQAFIPAQNKKDAQVILRQLNSGFVEKYLLSTKMEGTMSWAQPGKIKKIIEFK